MIGKLFPGFREAFDCAPNLCVGDGESNRALVEGLFNGAAYA